MDFPCYLLDVSVYLNSKRHVAVDWGSSRIRYGLGAEDESGKLNVLSAGSRSVRSGEGVFQGSQQKVSARSVKKVIETLNDWKEGAWKDLAAEVFVAHATSALRESANSKQVQRQIEKNTGIAIQLLDGADEATTISAAIIKELSPTIPLEGKTVLIVDLGGGSTEFCLVIDGHLCKESVRSIPVGTMRPILHRDFDSALTRGEALITLRRQLSQALDSVRDLAPNGVIDLVAGSGGNIREFGELQRRMIPGHTGQILTEYELENLLSLLSMVPTDRRADAFSMSDARADVIIPAGHVYSMCLKHLGIEQIRVSQSGLRHGLLLKSIEALAGEQRESDYSLAEKTAAKFCYGFNADLDLAERRASFATSIFDRTHGQHSLEDHHRSLLHVAAMVLDVGLTFTNENPHHKTSELLMAQPFNGLSYKDKLFVASLIRHCMETNPRSTFGEYLDRLSDKDHYAFATLNPIFRLSCQISDASPDPGHDFNLRVAEGALEIKSMNGFSKGKLKDLVKLHEEPFRRVLQLKLKASCRAAS